MLFNAGIPAAVLAALAPKNIDPRLLAISKQQLFYAVQAQPFITHSLIQAWGAKRSQDKVVSFLKSIFLPREKLAEIYSLSVDSHHLYFYYLVRLYYLCFQHGDTLWQLWRGNKPVVNRMEREIVLHDWLRS